MTPLRRRMIEDMQLRNFAPRIITVYVNCVVRFARHFGRSPELLGPDDVRTYLLDMIEQCVRLDADRLNQQIERE